MSNNDRNNAVIEAAQKRIDEVKMTFGKKQSRLLADKLDYMISVLLTAEHEKSNDAMMKDIRASIYKEIKTPIKARPTTPEFGFEGGDPPTILVLDEEEEAGPAPGKAEEQRAGGAAGPANSDDTIVVTDDEDTKAGPEPRPAKRQAKDTGAAMGGVGGAAGPATSGGPPGASGRIRPEGLKAIQELELEVRQQTDRIRARERPPAQQKQIRNAVEDPEAAMGGAGGAAGPAMGGAGGEIGRAHV